MDKLPIYIVLALIGLAVQPPVSRIAVNAGPHFAHYDEKRNRAMTAGVSAIAYSGLELGVAYARRGYDDTICAPGPKTSPDSGMDFGGIPPCFNGIQHFHRRVDYIDAKFLWREEVVADDRFALHLSFGGLAGFVRSCLNEARDSFPVGECLTHDKDVIGSLVAGGGVDVHIARQFDFTLDFQYAHELELTAREYAHGKVGYRTRSLLAGLAYRR